MANFGEKELKAHIKAGDFYPIYLICGDEDYLKKTYTDMIASKTVEPAFESFNLQKFEGKGLDLGDVFEQASIMPMMSDKRCLIVEDYKLEGANDKDISHITAYNAVNRTACNYNRQEENCSEKCSSSEFIIKKYGNKKRKYEYKRSFPYSFFQSRP